jgi:hypothetical protein
MVPDPSIFAMAGLDPVIHEPLRDESVDDRDKPGHDDTKT